ncbi:MAG: restriction endonuclease subunit S [Methanobacterium sp.]
MSKGFKETEIGLIPEEWEVKKIGDVCQQVRNSFNPNEKDIRTYIGLEHINEGSLTLNGVGSSSDVKSGKFVFLKGQILFGKLRPYFRKVYRPDFDGVCSTDILVIDKKDDYNNGFLFYFFANPLIIDIATQSSEGTKMPRASWKYLTELKFAFPNFKEQKAISDVLYVLDQKIHLNHQMNQTLEKIGENLFRHWFVHFEFPNSEGRPYKSSGGEMVDSELGEIPKGWEVGKFGKIVDNFDKKRIPLSKKQRESRKGQYPYYGATSIMDYVDDFLFDGTYVLMAEDGSVIDDGEKPVLQYVWGKFWVNNHAHVLKGQNGISDEFIYLLLKNTNIKHLVTGAVQLKINQKNMNNLQVVIPDLDILSKFSEIIKPLFAKYRVCSDENETLSQLRDSLLPKLMSGKIRVNISEEAAAK